MEKRNSIGAMWKKDGKNGPFLTGSLEIDGKKISFIAFKNSYKEKDNHPDFKIYEQEERGERPAPKVADNNLDDLF